MATCEVCGNHSDEVIEVTAAGVTHVFDRFQCAVHLMAPVWTRPGAGRPLIGSCPMAGEPAAPAVVAPPRSNGAGGDGG